MATWRFRVLSIVVGAAFTLGVAAGPAGAATVTKSAAQTTTVQSDNPTPKHRGGHYDHGGRNWGHRHGDRYWGPFGHGRGHSHFNICRSYQGHLCWW